jgi:hypothetical protein
VPWKKKMLKAIYSAQKKLTKYYAATDNNPYGSIYAIATILCPSKRLRYFDNDDWRGSNDDNIQVDWMKKYRDILQKEFDRYQERIQPQRYSTTEQAQQGIIDKNDDLTLLIDPHTALQPDVDQPVDEVADYLSQGKFSNYTTIYYLLTIVIGPSKGNPRRFWKEHEHKYPMARDILATPASGAGVERLFNYARDICHYQRGRLKPETIRELMLHSFSSKFELQQAELNRIKEHLEFGDALLLEESWKPTVLCNEIVPISDDEEEGCKESEIQDDSDIEQDASSTQPATQGQQTQRKRSYTAVTLHDLSEDDQPHSLSLVEDTQVRSGRIGKQPKLPAGFEIDRS